MSDFLSTPYFSLIANGLVGFSTAYWEPVDKTILSPNVTMVTTSLDVAG